MEDPAIYHTNKPKFSIGDVVVLNSGGPAMTIVDFTGPAGDKSYFVCSWFDEMDHECRSHFCDKCIQKLEKEGADNMIEYAG